MIKPYKDIISTLLNQLWRLFYGPLLIILIPLYLSEFDQGYWFLFVSLSALSVFADLGFTNIILQFSAHEFAYLRFDSNGLLSGDEKYLKQIGSFFRFTILWISSISSVVFFGIFFIGIIYLIRDGVFYRYIFQWTIYSFAVLISFLNNSVLSFIEGLNKIDQVQKIKFVVAVINTLSVITVLVCGGNVYALALGSLISALSLSILIIRKFRKLLFQLIVNSKNYKHNWRLEVMPLFMKYVVSFSSGYFMFQIYTPLMHYYYGPIQGGKTGLTLKLIMSIWTLSNVWIYTITPQINMLVSTQNWKSLNLIFKKRLWFSCITYSVGSILVLFLLYAGNEIIPLLNKYSSRFLSLIPTSMLLICFLFQLIINSIATYLRAHKQEPMVIFSVTIAIYVVLSTLYISNNYTIDLFFIGFLSSYLIAIPWAIKIYLIKREEWHEFPRI